MCRWGGEKEEKTNRMRAACNDVHLSEIEPEEKAIEEVVTKNKEIEKHQVKQMKEEVGRIGKD